MLTKGNIKFFDAKKGFGFITTENGKDIFVHITKFTNPELQVQPGDEVTFDVVDGRRGSEGT
jgi:CspA family cold shock protein